MADSNEGAKRLWNQLTTAEQDFLQRIGNKQEVRYPENDEALGALRFSVLAVMTVPPDGPPWERLIALTETGELVLAAKDD